MKLLNWGRPRLNRARRTNFGSIIQEIEKILITEENMSCKCVVSDLRNH